MALAFDTAHRPRSQSEWEALLEAIFNANSTDETHALEWKGDVNLTDRQEVARAIARTILAIANRPVEMANEYFDGYGILVIGLESQKTYPIAVLDSAVLGPLVRSFVGSANGPGWDMRYMSCRGQECLVIEVSPPREGDGIYALRKAIPKTDKFAKEYAEGTVFVRHQASSDQAKQDDFDALVTRARLDQKSKLDVHVGAAQPVANCWLLDQPNIERWLDGQKNAVLKSIEDNYRITANMARRGWKPHSMAPTFQQWVEEPRTERQFRDEVDSWVLVLRQYTEALGKTFGRVMGIAPAFIVNNKKDEHITNLRITLHLAGEVKAWMKQDGYPDLNCDLVKRPRIFGGYYKSLVAGLGKPALYRPAVTNLESPPSPQTKINHGGSVTIEPPAFNLRAKATLAFEQRVVFFVPPDRDDITVDWAADSENMPGRPTGTIPLTRGEPIDVFGGFLNEFNQTEWDAEP